MGIFLNSGNQKYADFAKTRYFVDKTELLNVLLEKDADEKFICCSRPRPAVAVRAGLANR